MLQPLGIPAALDRTIQQAKYLQRRLQKRFEIFGLNLNMEKTRVPRNCIKVIENHTNTIKNPKDLSENALYNKNVIRESCIYAGSSILKTSK